MCSFLACFREGLRRGRGQGRSSGAVIEYDVQEGAASRRIDSYSYSASFSLATLEHTRIMAACSGMLPSPAAMSAMMRR